MTLEPHTQSWKPMSLPKLAKVAPVANVFHSGALTARRTAAYAHAQHAHAADLRRSTLKGATTQRRNGTCMPHCSIGSPSEIMAGLQRVPRAVCSPFGLLRTLCAPSSVPTICTASAQPAAPTSRRAPFLACRVVSCRVVSCRASYARWMADLLRSAVCFGSACCSRRRPDRAGRCVEHPA